MCNQAMYQVSEVPSREPQGWHNTLDSFGASAPKATGILCRRLSPTLIADAGESPEF